MGFKPSPEGIAEERRENISDSVKALLVLTGVMILGVVATQVYAFQSVTWRSSFSYGAIALLVAVTSALSGALLGFLFGIPKTLQDGATDAPPGTEEAAGITHYRANTNLEHISDWLTKMLVGVGLTQITVLPEKLNELSTTLGRGLDNSDSSRIFIGGVILFFLISGFLFSYLWTRLFLPGAFRQADISSLATTVAKTTRDVEAVSKGVDEVSKEVVELKKQAELDARALGLAERQLSPSPDVPAISQEDLNDAIMAASGAIRIQIFSQAQKVREENWRENKARMEATAPIFRALIAADTTDHYHRNHAQLAYILRDKAAPDLKTAQAELTKAIEIRGPWQDKGWLFYEFNRALCRIQSDPGFRNNQRSDDEARSAIVADLRAAASGEPRDQFAREPDIGKWLSLNDLSEEVLDNSPGS